MSAGGGGAEKRVFEVCENEGAKGVYCDNGITSSKYSFYPWSPRFIIWKNLWEQFHRAANVYFLFLSAIMQVPGLSPFGRWTTLSTLTLVVLISMGKALYEDVLRHREDAQNNNTKVKALREGAWKQVRWIDVRVGDMILMEVPETSKDSRGGAPFPADLLLLATEGKANGVAYVETMDLDGETNLKPKPVTSFEGVRGMPADDNARKSYFLDPKHAGELKGTKLTVDKPGSDLTRLWGTLDYGGKQITFSMENALLRGARMRITETAVGVVMYTGKETRLGKNMSAPRSKQPKMEKLTNYRLLGILALQIVMCIMSAIGFNAWESAHKGAYYLDNPAAAAGDAAVSFFTFFILYSNLIPISLYVSMEIAKFTQGMFMQRDLEMYDKDKDCAAGIKTTDINDDLGQVNHIFCDKTGTLTQNVMNLFKFIVAGEVYGQGESCIRKAIRRREEEEEKKKRNAAGSPASPPAQDRPQTAEGTGNVKWAFEDTRIQNARDLKWSAEIGAPWMAKMFEVLSLCSTVLPSEGGAERAPRQGVPLGKLEAESPDELALVQAAAELGSALVAADTDEKVALVHAAGLPRAPPTARDDFCAGWGQVKYENLALVEFDSDRKRMSYVARRKDTGEIFIFSKGADSAMIPLLSTSLLPWQTQHLIDACAAGGDFKTALAAACPDIPPNSPEFQTRLVWFQGNVWRRSSNQLGALYAQWMTEYRQGRGAQVIQQAIADPVEQDVVGDYFHTQLMNSNATLDQVVTLAEEGLRTLYICRRRVPPAEWAHWGARWQHMKTRVCSQDERDAEKNALALEIERDLHLVGVTAIEDKLQDRVPECIASFRKAGIKVWMITGDKLNTAKIIAHGCALLDKTLDDERRGVKPIEIEGEKLTPQTIRSHLEKELKEVERRKAANREYAVIVTSAAVRMVHEAEEVAGQATLLDLMYQICNDAKSVVVARATPKQKAQIVDMIKMNNKWGVTLAIGDGANDVAMIQTAHVGVGIRGLEGGQAAAQADFSIAQYKYLHRLVFIHGRWNYRRLAMFSNYFFYKNAVLSFTLFMYNFFNGFSGQPLFDEWVIACYNVFWASWPVIIVGIIDRDITNTENIVNFPTLYRYGIINSDYTVQRFVQWYLLAILHAIIVLIVPLLTMYEDQVLDEDGRDYGLYHGGVLVYTALVLTITLKLSLHVRSWTWVHHFFIWGCLMTWPIFLPIYGEVSPSFFGIWVMERTFVDSVTWPLFWIMLFGTTTVCLLRDFVWSYLSWRFFTILPPADIADKVFNSGSAQQPGRCGYVWSMRYMSLFKILNLLEYRRDALEKEGKLNGHAPYAAPNTFASPGPDR
eukprot:TRINITY_DN11310_c0_g1_i1.p1 TRINITY_DN11310_c0_g1~~TRINITY_DN11310_c0_g1_i1.p1  ORF type:complete len:1328 (+),score=501.26 TRINITY_DN11310_c0_g1_i1:53-4036(+)